MKNRRLCFLAACGVALLLASTAPAQQARTLHIGYVYPAGGQQGTTFEVTVGGQQLGAVNDAVFSGSGVTARIADSMRPISQKELQELRNQLEQLRDRKAAAMKKTAKKGAGTNGVAHVKWTEADEQQLTALRMKLEKTVRRPATPAIAERVVLQVTVAPDAAPGDREMRLRTPLGLTNPLLFQVSQLPEFVQPSAPILDQSVQNPDIAPNRPGQAGPPRQPERVVVLPTVLNGQILPSTADRYRFAARKGQRLVFAVQAQRLIPYLADAVPGWFQAVLALYDADGREVAYDNRFRFHPDPVIFCEVPADGEYVLEIHDSIYRGREDFVYRIAAGELPFITGIFPLGGRAGEKTTVALEGWNLPVRQLTVDNTGRDPGVYPVSVRKGEWLSNLLPFEVDDLPEVGEQERNGQRRTAQPVTLPVIVNGRIGHPGDRDFFRFEGRAGERIVAEVQARRLDSPLDSIIRLSDAGGREIAVNDDCEDKGAGLETHHADSYLLTTLPADGTYYLSIGDAQHQGGPNHAYRLRISAPRPDFALRVAPSSLFIRSAGTTPITVYALRRDGFTNAIEVVLTNAPAGFKLTGGGVLATQEQARLTLTAPAELQPKLLHLELIGRALVDGRELAHAAVPAEDMMQAFAYRHLVPAQELETAVGSQYTPWTNARVLNELPLAIPVGGVVGIQVNVPTNTYMGRMEMVLNDPPAGIAIREVKAIKAGSEIVLTADAAQLKPGQKGNLIVSLFVHRKPIPGKGKPVAKNGATRRVLATTLPAIPYEIVAAAP